MVKQITNSYTHVKSGKRTDLNNVYFRSAWEANFARYLNLLVKTGDIVKWEYEPDRFEFDGIKSGTRSYIPDFKVWNVDESTPHYIEVKGWMDSKSKTKLKRMAKYYPDIKIIVFGKTEYENLRKSLSKVLPHWEGRQ